VLVCFPQGPSVFDEAGNGGVIQPRRIAGAFVGTPVSGHRVSCVCGLPDVVVGVHDSILDPVAPGGTTSPCAGLTCPRAACYPDAMKSSPDRNVRAGQAEGDKGRAEDDATRVAREAFERLALALVETCVRNTQLENLHAGVVPRSAVGDFSDVTVITPYGDIPWANLSRISDPEMKALMIEIVDRVFTFLQYPEHLSALGGAARWDKPKLDDALMRTVRRRAGDSVPFKAP